MFFYSFLKYYSIVCLDFLPWGGGFFDTFDWLFVSHPGEFDQNILKFVKSPPLARMPPHPPDPQGVFIDRCIKVTSKAMEKARVTSPAIHLREKD